MCLSTRLGFNLWFFNLFLFVPLVYCSCFHFFCLLLQQDVYKDPILLPVAFNCCYFGGYIYQIHFYTHSPTWYVEMLWWHNPTSLSLCPSAFCNTSGSALAQWPWEVLSHGIVCWVQSVRLAGLVSQCSRDAVSLFSHSCLFWQEMCAG